MNDKNLNFCSK